jgi:hypothetical protein
VTRREVEPDQPVLELSVSSDDGQRPHWTALFLDCYEGSWEYVVCGMTRVPGEWTMEKYVTMEPRLEALLPYLELNGRRTRLAEELLAQLRKELPCAERSRSEKASA